MNDILPDDTPTWQSVEAVVRQTVTSYGYREIRLPVVERTELFSRSIGELTDIVEKEMYTFEDRNGESLTLRPEATAGMVRAGISNGLLHNQRHRLWCMGSMFRYEKPQKGRYRQFHQVDVEAFGYPGPDVDAELILLCARLWRNLGLESVRLKINSLGTPASRKSYRKKLVAYFEQYKDQLDEDSLRRLKGNPLRILDSKNPDVEPVIADAPVIMDHLDAASGEHFESLQRLLDAAGLKYEVDPRLVRGLDYYTRTVFEWVTDRLGAQDAVCSGGRYDELVEQLGGRPTPAIGWALGLERLVSLVKPVGTDQARPDVYLVLVGEKALTAGLGLAEQLRDKTPALVLETHCGGGSFKSQLKKADRSGARLALILGDEEVSRGEAALKPLRTEEAQKSYRWEELPGIIARTLEAGA